MNEIERKRSSDDLSEEKTKKFHNEFKQQTLTCFEDLSNELLCEIFDYLNGYDLCKIFSNLNNRLEQLLHSSLVLYKIRCYLCQNDEIMNVFKQFMFSNRHQIFSIHVNFIFPDTYFFLSFLFDSSFDHLESIVFKHIQSDTIIPILSNLSSLPNLLSLTIETSDVNEKINDIYQLIFVLPKLKYYRFFFADKPHSITLPLAMNNQCSPIEYLVIDHYCSLNELVILTSYTTQLRRLTLHETKMNDSNMTILSSITLANLKSMYLNLGRAKFNELETFITKAFSNVETLSIIGSKDITFLDAYRWEQLIVNYFPKLEKFYLFYDDRIDNEQEYSIYTGEMDKFSSSFWIERQWLFEVEVRDISIVYIIRPYCKRWYDDTKHNIVNCVVEHTTFIDLTIECVLYYMFEKVVFKAIEHILTITHIYHLDILQKKISIPALIHTVNLLPDITTLRIHSLSIDETNKLTIQQIRILCSMKATSKVTKVYLEEIGNIQEFDFLFTLCPHMEYFKVKCISMMNIQSFLHAFFKKINRINNHSLRSLCFYVSTAIDEIIKNIQEMIKCEKLLSHFTIKCAQDTICLQWK
ncbi:unnamed protein product [Rotaria sp. Silwood1]|nr:unnamed protein product [Rotaria sp. Silwood1]